MNNSRIRLEFKGSCLKQDKVIFTPSNIVSFFIVYELSRSSKVTRADCTLKDFLFRAVEITADSDKYSYSGYGIGFDSPSLSSVSKFEIFFEFI